MPRRRGWDFAQLSATFPGDPEFVRLSRRAGDDRTFLAAVGLWVIALADAWHSDDPNVSDALSGFEDAELVSLLSKAGLVQNGQLAGFDKWTSAVRRQREKDAAHKRDIRQSPSDSDRLPQTDTESPRGVVEEVVEEVSPKGSPRAKASNGREPLLTKAQLDSWRDFGAEWDAFKDAWLYRGFLWPPYGSPEDDDTSQRGLLWSILDSRPTDLVTWVKQAPGKSATEVMGYVLEQWHTIRNEAEPTLPVAQVIEGPSRRAAPEHIRSVLGRLQSA